MRIHSAPLAALALALSLPSVAQEDEGRAYFSLSSNRSYRPGDKPSVQLWAEGVAQLQFRAYKVRDPIEFFRQLDDPHRFGGQAPRKARELTPLERFRAWKLGLKYELRDFVRGQYTGDSRATIRDWMAAREQKPVAPQAAPASKYAAVPLLNPQQVVAVWEQNVGSGRRWQAQSIPVDVRERGLYLVEATSGSLNAYAIASVTDLALIAKGAPGIILARLLDRKTGAPVADCPVVLQIDQKERARVATDASGLARFTIDDVKPENVLLMARRDDDFAVATVYSWFLSTNPDRNTVGYVYTDRPVYRPGHEVHLRAILRAQGETFYNLPAHKEVQAQVQAPDGRVAFSKTLPVSPFGTVNADFTIAADAALGYYGIEIHAGESSAYGGFNVEEYRKPEFAVAVRPSKRRLAQGEPIEAEIEARYFYGEPVANGKVTYLVYKSRYWSYGSDDEDASPEEEEADYGAEQVLQENAELNAGGKVTVRIPNEPDEHDLQYWIEARVSDASNREVSGTGGVVATVGPFRIDIQGDKYIYQAGDKARFRIETRDYEGQPVPDIAFKVVLREYRYQGEPGAVLHTAEGRTDQTGNASIEATIPDRGSLIAEVSAAIEGGRRIRDAAYMWVSSYGGWYSSSNQRLTLVPDKRSYKPGEVAKVLIVTGAPEANLWVTAEGRGIRDSRFIEAKTPTVTVEIPVQAEYAPNFFVTATFVRDDQIYQGGKSLKVPPVDRQLQVELTSSKDEYKPGETGSYSLLARDSSGQPVSAEFSLGVVDEAIYSVRKENMPEILPFFYGQTYNRVAFTSSLSYNFYGEAGRRRMQLAQAGKRKARAQLKPGDLVQPQVRKAFPDTILWLADVRTDAGGRATARVTYPDALTTWRATARGVTKDTKVGVAKDHTIVRKNLILRLAVPRFFTEGDEVTLSALVHNYLKVDKQVRISLEAKGLEVLEGTTTDVAIASRAGAKVDYRVRALPGEEEVVLLGKALTDEESDALELRIPVIPYGVKLSQSHTGALTEPAQQAQAELSFPPETIAHSTKIEISVTPSVAGTILGALDFLTSFPYGCTEQTMSSFLPNVIVAQAAKDLNLKTGIDQAALARKVRAGLTRLYSFQHEDGGWGWWQSDDSDVFMTAYVVTGLKQAEDAGYAVQPGVRERSVDWLRGQTSGRPNERTDLQAYVAYALSVNGAPDGALLDRLWNQRAALTSYGLALLGLALNAASDERAVEAAAQLEAAVKKDQGGAYWEAARDSLLDIEEPASHEATAYALKLLSAVRPESALRESAAMWLVLNRDRGSYWSSTKQTAFVIYGLIDYLKASQELSPNFGVTVKVNGKEALNRRFAPADALLATPVAVQLDAAQLESGVNRIEIAKNGEGRLYWSARSDYYTSRDSFSQAGDKALAVKREYFKLAPQTTGDKIVHRLDPLSGPLAPGDVVAVRLTVDSGSWRYLLIEDPIPAGTELIARDDLYDLTEKPDWWTFWSARREFHDDRAAFFQNYPPYDSAPYVYLLKVVNPGQYRVSPARVSPMYQPEFIATSESKSVEVR
ncbi:MAG: alpha-2-macroglobulin [Bryobacteraceae bacterium]|nr:alpha-2-macroglobulin [Bryobacteraceae bacterium]